MDEIIDNIFEYKGCEGDLVKALRRYNVKTYQEFTDIISEYVVACPNSMRERIKWEYDNLENNDWQNALQANTIDAYNKYLEDYPSGTYAQKALQSIERINQEKECEVVWQSMDKTNVADLNNFILKYPWSSHTHEAQAFLDSFTTVIVSPDVPGSYNLEAINELKKEMQRIKQNKLINNPESSIANLIVGLIQENSLTVHDLLGAIREDNNFISSFVANRLWTEKILTDYSTTGIDDEFIEYVKEGKALGSVPTYQSATQVTKSPCVELYFWGIPSSGKTCALGAIMSAANRGTIATSMSMDSESQGYGYMDKLSTMFDINNPIGVLPKGNAISATYEMGFDLEDKNGLLHPITCVDLAGELIDSMHKHNSKLPLTAQERSALDTLTYKLLKNGLNRKKANKKIHFFVIEYGAENRTFNDKPQSSLLAAAAEYIRKTSVFEKDTDAIYILISKVDKIDASGQELVDHLRNYMVKYYQGFFNTLTKICKNNKINNGMVEIKPFSIGKVCFENYCKFNDEAANDVVRTMLRRTKGYTYKELTKLSK